MFVARLPGRVRLRTVALPSTAEDLLAMFRSGWDKYNEGENAYEDDVAKLVPLYVPFAHGPVLGGGL